MKNHKYLIFALIFTLLNIGIIFVLFGAQKYGDSSGYIEVINWLRGQGWQADSPYRLLKPLGPLIALPFEFFGEGAGLVAQNTIFYLFCSLLIFKITELIYRDKKQAMFAAIFFAAATPMIEFGLSYLVDVGSWFFYLFSIFLTLFYFKKRDEKLIFLNGFISGLGLLMKEPGGLGALFFGLMVLFSGDFNFKEKILKIARFSAFFIIPFGIVQILVWKYFHYSYLDWYSLNTPSASGEPSPLIVLHYLGQLFRILGILWIFVLIGIWRESQEKNWERIRIFLFLIPASFSFLLWNVSGGGRAAFIFAPLGILLATHGCKKIKPLAMALIILVLLALNYSFVAVNQKIPFTDIIYQALFK